MSSLSQTPDGSAPTHDRLPERPMVAPGVQRGGEMPDPAFVDRQWLIVREGNFVQLTELLYRVLEQMDGERTYNEIAAGVTDATKWLVTGDQVRQLVATKLTPL